mmetsp:Transcript_31824/g.87614  ORF Transcript_31824/g.87614 Transcript_31824/m.87614 type:complete len:211 (-) Transcript_31824:619-1251(-)
MQFSRLTQLKCRPALPTGRAQSPCRVPVDHVDGRSWWASSRIGCDRLGINCLWLRMHVQAASLWHRCCIGSAHRGHRGCHARASVHNAGRGGYHRRGCYCCHGAWHHVAPGDRVVSGHAHSRIWHSGWRRSSVLRRHIRGLLQRLLRRLLLQHLLLLLQCHVPVIVLRNLVLHCRVQLVHFCLHLVLFEHHFLLHLALLVLHGEGGSLLL